MISNDNGDTEKPAYYNIGGTGGFREGSGRKKFKPTDEERKLVEAMSGYGVPIKQIATFVRGGIDKDTLHARFKEDLIKGKAIANAKVGQTLHQKAVDGDTTAAIWWSKTQMGWKEESRVEHAGDPNAPIEHRVTTINIVPM